MWILFYFINVSYLSSTTLCRFASPSSLLSSLFLLLTSDDNSAFCQESKSLRFPKTKVNVKLIHTSGLGVRFCQYEVDYRSAKRPLSLMMVSYMKIIDRRTLGRPIQVNGTFCIIKTSQISDGSSLLGSELRQPPDF